MQRLKELKIKIEKWCAGMGVPFSIGEIKESEFKMAIENTDWKYQILIELYDDDQTRFCVDFRREDYHEKWQTFDNQTEKSVIGLIEILSCKLGLL